MLPFLPISTGLHQNRRIVMAVTVGDVAGMLEHVYPPELAEPWDTGIGLTCGNPAAKLSAVLLAVDLDAAVVDEAIDRGVQLIVTHHPLLFRAVQSVAADSPKGALVHRLIRAGIAHYSAHTNADKAVDGVSDALAAALGVSEPRPLVPDPPGLLPAAHPQAGRTGLGRIGRLPAPTTLAQFLQVVARALPGTAAGVRAAGDPARVIRTVAVCGGAGDGELSTATAAGADVYLTSDLRHHVVAEHLAVSGAAAVVDVAHWAGEWPWLGRAAEVLTRAVPAGGQTGSVTFTVSTLCTDPWTRLILPTVEGLDTSAEG